MAQLIGSFGLSTMFPLDNAVVQNIPFDRMLKQDGTALVPTTLVTNAQVTEAGDLTPAEVGEVLKLMYGVNLSFQGFYKRSEEREMNPITRRVTRKTVQTEKLEPKGWMFFASGVRAMGVVALTDDILAKVRALRK